MKVSIGKNNMWICYTLENWRLLCYFSTVAIKFLFYNSSGYSFQVGLKGGINWSYGDQLEGYSSFFTLWNGFIDVGKIGFYNRIQGFNST